jgi:hypothetical protein
MVVMGIPFVKRIRKSDADGPDRTGPIVLDSCCTTSAVAAGARALSFRFDDAATGDVEQSHAQLSVAKQQRHLGSERASFLAAERGTPQCS